MRRDLAAPKVAPGEVPAAAARGGAAAPAAADSGAAGSAVAAAAAGVAEPTWLSRRPRGAGVSDRAA